MTSTLPLPVGPLSERVITALLDNTAPRRVRSNRHSDDPLEHDLQLALYCLDELHFGGWVGVDDRLEWHADVNAARTRLEDEFERRLVAALPASRNVDPRAEVRELLDLGGPSVSAHLRDEGTVDQVRESMILRSPYQLKEADPHTFVVPRLPGPTKRVLCDIQAGEYGVGHRRSHAELFADALTGLGLDATPNAHIDRCGGAALATSNLVTLGALHRRRRGIVLGQLSLFEMDSVVPNGRMVECCDRLELNSLVRPFFHIHVLADSEHEVMVESAFLVDYPALEPDQVANMVLGMRAQSMIDHALADRAVPAWERGESALEQPTAARGRQVA